MHTCSYCKHGNEEEGRIVTFATQVCRRDEVVFRVVGVMEVYMITEEPAPYWMVAELVMHQRLRQ